MDALTKRKREIRDYLQDSLDNAAYVQRFMDDVIFDTFVSDPKSVYAVLHALLIIDEASRKIPAPSRNRHPEVPWWSIAGLRNVVAHEYFAVNRARIWQITQEDLPALPAAITRMQPDLEQEGHNVSGA